MGYTIYNVLLDSGAKYSALSDDSLQLKEEDWCVIRKDKVLDYGQVLQISGILQDENKKFDFPMIEHKATVRDKSKANENQMRAKSAMRTAAQYADNLTLDMKFLNAHYSFDCKLVTFQFTSEGRVDFRELLKQLSHSLNTKIELRQIGVRDETAIHGGIGICGQELCCSRYLKDFDSINVKMAKDQDLSLNPINISGCCGRLKCCLKFEHDGYLKMAKEMPRLGELCKCECGHAKIIERNLLTQEVTVVDSKTGVIKNYHKSEIKVMKKGNSKPARKNKK